MELPTIRARLLGRLEISDGHLQLTQEDIHSDRVTKLAAYLIMNGQKGCSFQQLIDDLWPNGQSENPVNALKNVMYRLRKALGEVWPGIQFFLTSGGQYQWNPDLTLYTDMKEFYDLYNKAGLETSRDIRQDLLLQAANIYKGKFLADFADEHWILYAQVHYHRMYLTVVRELAGYLEENHDYKSLEHLCADAVILEPFDEVIHSYLFKAYVGEDLPAVAERHYRSMKRMLMEQLGVEPSQELREMFNELMQRRHRKQRNLDIIEGELLEERPESGACRCTYSEFRKIYELESRRKERLKFKMVLGRIILEMKDENSPDWDEESAILQVMNDLEELMVSTLRTEDVVTRYSDCEFLVLLPDCAAENVEKIIERVRGKVNKIKNRWKKVRIQYSTKEIS